MVRAGSQETVVSKKRRGPAPTGKGTPVTVRLQPDDLELLDTWIVAAGGDVSRPEAIRRILRLVARDRLPSCSSKHEMLSE
jgi:hypothetical protein